MPAPSRALLQTPPSVTGILPATGNAVAPVPSDTTGHLAPAFVHPEKQQEARPCFPTIAAAENEIARIAPAGPAVLPGKARSSEGWWAIAKTAAPTHSTSSVRPS